MAGRPGDRKPVGFSLPAADRKAVCRRRLRLHRLWRLVVERTPPAASVDWRLGAGCGVGRRRAVTGSWRPSDCLLLAERLQRRLGLLR
ncbi:hypothetical protein GCM10009534_67510 [Kribbella sandramycini]